MRFLLPLVVGMTIRVPKTFPFPVFQIKTPTAGRPLGLAGRRGRRAASPSGSPGAKGDPGKDLVRCRRAPGAAEGNPLGRSKGKGARLEYRWPFISAFSLYHTGILTFDLSPCSLKRERGSGGVLQKNN